MSADRGFFIAPLPTAPPRCADGWLGLGGWRSGSGELEEIAPQRSPIAYANCGKITHPLFHRSSP